MGTVSLAIREDGRFRRVYAMKRLRPENRHDPRVRAMFLEEARIAGLLHHPNVVSVVDVGEDDQGPYLVMDYVQGVSLAELVTASRERAELVPQQICVRIIKQVAQGLHAAHELTGHDGAKLGLVHRDVSPQNILVGYDGVARLTDFGIAKALGRNDRTNTGILKGKVGYFAPEQLQFEKPTRRSDIFSLGIVLYELLTSQRLYGGEDQAEVARRIIKEELPDLDDARSDVHPVLEELLYEMLARDPSVRPSIAAEVVERLDAILSQLVVNEGAVSVPTYFDARFEERRLQQQEELDVITREVSLHPLSAAPRSKRKAARALLWAALFAGAVGVWVLAQKDAGTETSLRQGLGGATSAEAEIEAETEAEIEAETETASEPAAAKPRRSRKRTATPPRGVKPAPAPKPTPARSSVREDLAAWGEGER